MKYIRYIFILFCALQPAKLFSQVTVNATDTIGCDTLTTTFSQSNPTISSISWNFGDGSASSSELTPRHFYAKPGKYNVEVNVNGTETGSVIIKVFPKPVGGIEYRDTVTNSPLIVALDAIVYNESEIINKPFSYVWNIDGTNEGINQHAKHTFDSIGTYIATVIISDSRGCKDSVKKVLQIAEKLDIPNIFTPNNDNINDIFIVNSNDKYFLNFQLFTRSGLSVYKIKAKTIEWDGKMPSGEDVPAGIYYYIIEAEGAKPPLKQKGFLYIMR